MLDRFTVSICSHIPMVSEGLAHIVIVGPDSKGTAQVSYQRMLKKSKSECQATRLEYLKDLYIYFCFLLSVSTT